MNPFIPFALPDIGDEEIEAVIKAMQSGWLTTGPNAREFEIEFARYLGGDVEAVAVNSATAGLHPVNVYPAFPVVSPANPGVASP